MPNRFPATPPSVLVFTPIQVGEGLRGEVLAECRIPHPVLPAILPSDDFWRPWLTQLVTDHSALPGYSTLKYSRNGEVFRACFPTTQSELLEVVCRLHRTDAKGASIPGRASHAARGIGRALRLLEAGIDTAVPLARIEQTSRPRRSWLVTEYVSDVVDLDQIVLTLLPQQDRQSLHKLKVGTSEAVVELLARLDEARLYHRDLKASNILFTHWNGRDGTAKPLLVDLDGLHHRYWWNAHRRWQPLIRLAASLKDYPALTRTDFVRFLRQYLCRIGTPTAKWKTHFRRHARRAADYARHSQLRKSHKLDGYTAA